MKHFYIYQQSDWPNFTWNSNSLLPRLSQVRHLQGKLIGEMAALGFSQNNEASLATLTLDILKTTEIEGENLNKEQVRSSIARHLGMDIPDLIPSEKYVDGIVEMILDATQAAEEKLSQQRLFAWHASLFPTGRSGMRKIRVGAWRKSESDPMQVVSGSIGKERVHFEAPEAEFIPKEIKSFIQWINHETAIDPVLKAGIAHLWFLIIHPFEDGNGRIARAIADMLLARSDKSSHRFYSLSAQIQKERTSYYDILEKVQKGSLDITPWLLWFLNCLECALLNSHEILRFVRKKADFWKIHAPTVLNERQRRIINLLLDGFKGKLQSSKWAKINKCSPDTALRDIKDLIEKGILRQESSGGRSTHYELKDFDK